MKLCPQQEKMNGLLNEELSAAELAALDAHVEQCGCCQEQLHLLTSDPLIQPRAERPAAVRCGEPPDEATTPHGTDTGATLSLHGAPFLAPPQVPGEFGRLGNYRVLKVLGEGGMGIVFQAEDLQLGRQVALKVVRPEAAAAPDARARFLREARACAALKNDHVITIHQVGEERGVLFMAMELLEGMPLDRWLKEGGTPDLAQILRIGRETAAGLAAAHAKGLVHRDVKPGNLWLEQDYGRIKILDFGLARLQTEDVHLTQTGLVVGTPSHMAPEQAGGGVVDERCDLFSLGVVLYRLCSGQQPFRGETTMALLTSLAVDAPRSVRSLNPEVPAELSELIDRLLEKRPEDRPASAHVVVEALAAIERAHAQVSAAPPPPPPATSPAEARSRGPRRKAVLIGLAALAGVLLAVVVIIIRNKDGSETRIEVPKGATVEVRKDGQVTKIGPAKPVGTSPADQLAVITWLMKDKGLFRIDIEQNGKTVKRFAPPSLPFKITKLSLNIHSFGDKKPLAADEIVRVAALVDLQELNLGGQPVTDEVLERLVGLSELRQLSLIYAKVTPAAAQTLQRFPKLESLSGIPPSEEWLKALVRMPALKSLGFYRTHVTGQAMRQFKNLPHLTQLNFKETTFQKDALSQLKEAKQLRLLVIANQNGIDKATFERLAQTMPWCEIHDHPQGSNPTIYNEGKAGDLKAEE